MSREQFELSAHTVFLCAHETFCYARRRERASARTQTRVCVCVYTYLIEISSILCTAEMIKSMNIGVPSVAARQTLTRRKCSAALREYIKYAAHLCTMCRRENRTGENGAGNMQSCIQSRPERFEIVNAILIISSLLPGWRGERE